MNWLAIVWVCLAFPVGVLQFRDRNQFTPLTNRITWAWIAGLVVIMVLWKATA